MKVDWDPRKAASNLRKHGVSFDEASTVFLDPLALSYPDPEHSADEARYITFGISRVGRLLLVAHTYRSEAVRIFSARRADRSERKTYEEG